MAKYYRHFGGDTVGGMPSGWTKRFGLNSSFAVTASAGSVGDKMVRETVSAGNDAASMISLNDAGTPTDAEVLMRFKASSTSQDQNLAILRASGSNGNVTAYGVGLRRGNEIVAGRWKNSGGGINFQRLSTFNWASNTWYWLRVRISGSNIKGRVWSGSVYDEPSSWQIDWNDSAPITGGGWVGVGGSQVVSGLQRDFDVVSIGTNGDTAPAESLVPTELTAPTGVTLSNLGNNQATLSWNAVSGAETYEVVHHAATSHSHEYDFRGIVQTNAIIADLPSNLEWSFKVRAVSSSLPPSPYSTVVTGTPTETRQDVTPPTPSGFTSRLSFANIRLGWTPNAPANTTHYFARIRPEGASDSEWTLIRHLYVEWDSWLITNLAPGVTYEVGLQARNLYSASQSPLISPWTATQTLTVPAEADQRPPNAVTGLRITATTGTSVALAWNESTLASLYQVEYGLAGAEEKLYVTTANLTRTVTGLASGVPYEFRVRAQNSFGWSPFSGSVTAIPRTEPPVPAASWTRDKWLSGGDYLTAFKLFVGQRNEVTNTGILNLMDLTDYRNTDWFEGFSVDVNAGSPVSVGTFTLAARDESKALWELLNPNSPVKLGAYVRLTYGVSDLGLTPQLVNQNYLAEYVDADSIVRLYPAANAADLNFGADSYETAPFWDRSDDPTKYRYKAIAPSFEVQDLQATTPGEIPAINGVVNMVADWEFEFLGTYTSFHFRRVDANNHWRVQVNADGRLQLTSVVNGTATARAFVDGLIVPGEDYRIVFLVVNRTVKVWLNGVQRLSYTHDVDLFHSATIVQKNLEGNPGANVRAWPRNHSLAIDNAAPYPWVLWEGYIDETSIDGNALTLSCRDLGARAQDHFMTGSPDQRIWGSTSGTPLQTVIQHIVLSNQVGDVPVALYTANDPGFLILRYQQQQTTVLEAIQRLAEQIGYEVRYRPLAPGEAWVLTLYEPKVVIAGYTFLLNEEHLIAFSRLSRSRRGYRNSVAITFRDVTNNNALTRSRSYVMGERPHHAEIIEEKTSQINTPDEALRFASYFLAQSAMPEGDVSVTLPFFPWVQLDDTIGLDAPSHLGSRRYYVVAGYTHTAQMSDDSESELLTTITLRALGQFVDFNTVLSPAWRSESGEEPG